MRSYAVKIFCEALEPMDTPAPTPKGTEVLIDVTRCGVCHSDLHIQEGYYDLGGGKKLSLADRGVQPPVVMGHEVLGRLVAKGPDAPIGDDMIGKTFLVYPWTGCGKCGNCLSGMDNLCAAPNAVGVHRAGGYAEMCVVPHPRHLVDVTGIDPTLAATYACSGLTAYSALKKTDIDREKDRVLIMGLGGVGLSGLYIAQGLGFKHIAVADIDADKRAFALANGAEAVVDPRDADAIAKLQGLEGGIAAVIDFVGATSTTTFGFNVLRKGGTYVVVGLFGGEFTFSIPMVILRALSLKGSYVGSLNELRELIDIVRSGKIKPIPTATVPMANVNEALEKLRSGKVSGRLVLERA